MLNSHSRLLAAIVVGALSLTACSGGTPQMTPLAPTNQAMSQTQMAALSCKALPLRRGQLPPSGCTKRDHAHDQAVQAAGSVQVFDVPGAIKASKCTQYQLFNDCGTFSYGLNAKGVIIGNYLKADGVITGFVRTTGGHYTSFEAPGTDVTSPFQINDGGAIVGQYADSNNVVHGFVRTKGGSISTYDAPWAGQMPNDSVPQGTGAGAINAGGDTAGLYWDAQGLGHGFIRTGSGSFVQVIPNGSVSSSICIACLNDGGVAAGDYRGTDGIARGFIRSATGTIKTIAKSGAASTGVTGINNHNTVLAFFVDSNNVVWGLIHGGKKQIVFQDPKASKTYGNGTQPEAINDAGAVTGFYADAQGNVHGFYRSSTGKYSEFDPPGSVFTEPYGINDNGTVTGYWYDAQGANHGFIWTPQ